MLTLGQSLFLALEKDLHDWIMRCGLFTLVKKINIMEK